MKKEQTASKSILSCGLRAGTGVQVKGNLNIYMVQELSKGIVNGVMSLSDNAEVNIYSNDRNLEFCHIKLKDNAVMNVVSEGQAVYYGSLTLEDSSCFNIRGTTDFGGITSNGTNYPLTINLNSTHAQMNVESSNRLFSNSNNQLTFNAISGAKFSHNGKVYKTDTDVSDNTMTGNTVPAGFTEQAGETAPSLSFLDGMVASLRAKAAQGIKGNTTQIYTQVLDSSSFAEQYNKIFEQYDKLISDASYQGVNLLKNEKLDVVFNESRKNKLTVQGQDMTSAALGLTTAEWTTQIDIANAIQELVAAKNKIRSFQSELGNNYSIIQTRQDFTEALTDVLETGSDNLVLSDMNEESANYLALQTRQQLATNSLSLAA